MENIKISQFNKAAYETSAKIMQILHKYSDGDISDFEHHRIIIEGYVSKNVTIQAILPAFPGKPINPNLAPSHIPDGAEEYAISKLNEMIESVKGIYEPGINVKLFHDGYYFIHLAMDYDYYRMQEYVDMIKHLCIGKNIESIDFKDVTEGSTFEARMNFWNFMYYPGKEEVENYNSINTELYDGMVIFFFNNFSKYLYPSKSNKFRRKLSKYVAENYICVNMSIQNFLKAHYQDHLRLSVKRQSSISSKKLYFDLLQGIESRGLPWMNTLIEEGGKKIVRKFREV